METCTNSPTSIPTSLPTLSSAPTDAPTESKACKESYLESDSLNIALVIDLSYSTVDPTDENNNAFVNVGDINGDGYSNTILDAEVRAVQDLLSSISNSDTLTNDNCEIELISFHTGATSHGVWNPLDSSGNPNDELMTKVRNDLRAPSEGDVESKNLGYTNFDDALDRAVEYFDGPATAGRRNLLVFLSDGVPNVRGVSSQPWFCSRHRLCLVCVCVCYLSLDLYSQNTTPSMFVPTGRGRRNVLWRPFSRYISMC